MSSRTTAERLLERLPKTRLRDFARWYELNVAGTKAALASRVASHVGFSLELLVSRAGPCYLREWNDLVQASFGGERRRSFEGVRDELQRLLGGTDRVRYERQELLEMRVADVRRLELSAAVAEALDLEEAMVLESLEEAHGNARIFKVLRDLIDEPPTPPSQDSGGERRLIRGRYEIVAELGKGGFGSTYEAIDHENPVRGRVVLKFSHGEEVDEVLVREIMKAHQLLHPNICRYYDYAKDNDGRPFLVLAYGGRSLEALIEERTTISVRLALEVTRQVAEALDYAHSMKIVHGDVNPGNILLEKGRLARLTDFGIAAGLVRGKRTRGRATMRATSLQGYHPCYSSPEVSMGHTPRRASDQYSLALVLCSMLEGAIFETAYKRRGFKRLNKRQNAAIARALDWDPDRRFDSCADFVAALRP